MRSRVVAEIRRVSLNPGDVLVVRVHREISAAEAAQIKALIEPKFPGHQVLVCNWGTDISVIGPGERA